MCIQGADPGLLQTGLSRHRKRLGALNFGYKRKSGCSICETETKALICGFVLAYVKTISLMTGSKCSVKVQSCLDGHQKLIFLKKV